MDGIKESGQAVGAQVLTELSGFAPPTIMAQAARLQARQRLFNLVVTNVPGPQMPLYVLGRELDALYPMVPLAENTALGIAIMSYNGQLNFGLTADYDALSDVETLADELRSSIEELAAAAGPHGAPVAERRTRAPRGAPSAQSSEDRDNRARARRDRRRVAAPVGRSDRGPVGVLRRPRPGRRRERRHARDRASSSPTSATPISRPGQPRPAYDSNPPTSGAHIPEPGPARRAASSTTTSCSRRSRSATS